MDVMAGFFELRSTESRAGLEANLVLRRRKLR
jgi:hypothetical protein